MARGWVHRDGQRVSRGYNLMNIVGTHCCLLFAICPPPTRQRARLPFAPITFPHEYPRLGVLAAFPRRQTPFLSLRIDEADSDLDSGGIFQNDVVNPLWSHGVHRNTGYVFANLL